MINTLEDIRDLWSPDDLGIDDTDDSSGVTRFERFLVKNCDRAERRVRKLVPWSIADAAGEEVKAAEIEFLHVFILEHLWHMKASGFEREIRMPGGFQVSLQAFNSEEYERLTAAHISNAERELLGL